MLRVILAPTVQELPAYAIGFQESRRHGVVQVPDHGDGALAFKANTTPAAEELERGREGAVGAVESDEQINGITARGVVY